MGRAQRLKHFKILKFSSEIENSSAPPTKPLFFWWGIPKVGIDIFLVDVSDIFNFFLFREGKGESGATGREGGRFFIESPRRGGGSPKRGWEGARGPGGCLQGIWANWGGG